MLIVPISYRFEVDVEHQLNSTMPTPLELTSQFRISVSEV